jgi:hypothetical protein
LIAAIGTEFVLQSVVALFQNGILFFVVVASVLHSVSSYASDDKIRVKIIREEDHDFCRGQQRTTLQQASDLKTAALMEGLIANPSSNKPIETFNIDQIKTTLGSKEMNNSQIYGLAERVLESYSLFSMAFDLINRSDLKNTYVRENIGTQIVVGYLLLDHKMKKKLNPYFTTEEIRGKLLEFQKGELRFEY